MKALLNKKVTLPLATAALLAMSGSANAGWVGGVGYSMLSDSDFDFEAFQITVGRTLDMNVAGLVLTPELRLWSGANREQIDQTLDVKFDHGVALALRGEYAFGSAYAFVAPSYGRYVSKVRTFGQKENFSSNEFGIGGGLGYNFNERTAIEVTYDNVDSLDIISAALRIRF
ncbi:MAG: outer membrane beta-barrel protein [Idiomarina sp.]|nr:outer membrane beta-barrel protein [Idiomarina sp.]